MKYDSFYNDRYFAWQKDVGVFGGWANITKFFNYIHSTDKVIDFGCGGGYLLKNLKCKEKIGIEINKSAIETAENNGITVCSNIDDIEDNWADIVISNNALEHTSDPLSVLRQLRLKIRDKGKAVFIVPCDSIKMKYQENDMHRHLYSWSPSNLGNIFNEAGFTVIESKPYMHKWPPRYTSIAKYFGRNIFELSCRLYGHLNRKWIQVRIIAEKR